MLFKGDGSYQLVTFAKVNSGAFQATGTFEEACAKLRQQLSPAAARRDRR